MEYFIIDYLIRVAGTYVYVVLSYFNLLLIKKGRIFMKKKMFLLGFIGGVIGSITSHIITAIL